MKETKFVPSTLPVTSTCTPASQLAIYYPPKSMCIFGGGWSKMKTSQIQRNRFLMTEPRHHGDGQVMGMGWGRDILEEWNCPTSTQITLGADSYS